MTKLRFTINGPTAKQNATQLIEKIPEAEIKPNESTTRGGLFISIVEVINSAGQFAGSIGGAISLAQVVWDWHKSRKNKVDSVTISKSEEGQKSISIILDDNITEEDIRLFLKSKG